MASEIEWGPVAKGTSLVCAFPNTWEWKNFIRSKKVTFTESDDKLFVDAIVAGDDENGMSIVALDNPLWCLSFAKIRKGLINEMRRDALYGYRNVWLLSNFVGGNPVCPFSS